MSFGGRQPRMVKEGKRGAWPGSRDTVKFGVLNANSSKTGKDTNFKFGTHARRVSPVMTTENFFRKRAWPG